jgi:HK97 family phage prohead protease
MSDERIAAAERRKAAMESRDDKPRLAERQQRTQNGDGSDKSVTHDRYLAFAAQLEAREDKRDDKDFYVVEGVASTFDQPYEMYDVHGPYEERVAAGAADSTLAAKPDVVFLINHKGLALARTGGAWNDGAGTLDIWAERDGMHQRAWLNPKRSEVKDLALAMGDKIVTEMSFAFMIDEGRWNDDFTEYTIQRFDLNRGDVSAVNYGANPYTSIAARQQEILTDLRKAGPSMARAALASLLGRDDLDIDELTERYSGRRDVRPEPEPSFGRSLTQIEAMLEA